MAINTKKNGDSGYVCGYMGKRIEVYAATTLEARTLAAKYFKTKKDWAITTWLAERPDGSSVVHQPNF